MQHLEVREEKQLQGRAGRALSSRKCICRKPRPVRALGAAGGPAKTHACMRTQRKSAPHPCGLWPVSPSSVVSPRLHILETSKRKSLVWA